MFRAPPDSIAERLADRFAALHPAVAGAIALAIGYVALVVTTIAAGVLLIEVVLTGSVLNWDNEVIDWLAEHRTRAGTDVSSVGSHLAETGTVLAIVAVVALVLCLHRRFVATLFFVTAIAVEAATYLATTLVIDRPRPHVVRLENLDPGASYPSGHTAAGVVIYVGIAMLVLAYVKNRAVRVAAVVIAVIAPAGGRARANVPGYAPPDRRDHRRVDRPRMSVRWALGGPGVQYRQPWPSSRGGEDMTSVAVIAHTGKSLGGGLGPVASRARG